MINRCETCGGSWYQDQPEKHLMTCRPTPTEMEERVTDALFDAMDGRLELHDARRLARAAIRAMRDPPPDMEAKMRTLVMTPLQGGKHWYAAAIDAASPPEEDEVVGLGISSAGEHRWTLRKWRD